MAHSAKSVREMAKSLGLHIEVWAPGDGSKRYTIYSDSAGTQRLHSTDGPSKAMAYLWGFRAGRGS